MNIRDYYRESFPSDELGYELNETATFGGLFWTLNSYGDIYDYIGVTDSIVRERLFEKLSQLIDCDYNEIYEQWLQAA